MLVLCTTLVYLAGFCYVYLKSYYTMPRIAKQKDRTIIYKSGRGTHASCYAFKRLTKY